MIYSKQDAVDYYDERFEHNIDYELSGDTAFKLLDNELSFWEWKDKNKLAQVVKNVSEKLDEMLKTGEAADDYENLELMAKESWEENMNGVQDEYPNWEDYKDSKDYQNEIDFYSEQAWNDFNENYSDELEMIKDWRDWDDLKYKLRKLVQEVDEMESKVADVDRETRREVIRDCFE